MSSPLAAPPTRIAPFRRPASMRSASIPAIVDPMPSALSRIIIRSATASQASQEMHSMAVLQLAASRTTNAPAISSV